MKGFKTVLIVFLGIALVVLYLTTRHSMVIEGSRHGPAGADCLMITLVIVLALFNQKRKKNNQNRKKKDTPSGGACPRCGKQLIMTPKGNWVCLDC